MTTLAGSKCNICQWCNMPVYPPENNKYDHKWWWSYIKLGNTFLYSLSMCPWNIFQRKILTKTFYLLSAKIYNTVSYIYIACIHHFKAKWTTHPIPIVPRILPTSTKVILVWLFFIVLLLFVYIQTQTIYFMEILTPSWS